MKIIQKHLWAKFGQENVKVSSGGQELDLQQTGEQYFSAQQDAQFYAYEENTGIKRIPFSKRIRQKLAWGIALEYYNGELGSKFPTHLICVIGARSSSERDANGLFNCIVYHLTNDQIKQVSEQYEDLVA